MFKYILSVLILFIGLNSTNAQNIEPQNGVDRSDHTLYAITNVTVYKSADEKIENAVILFQDGIITKVSKLSLIPKQAVKINMDGFTI